MCFVRVEKGDNNDNLISACRFYQSSIIDFSMDVNCFKYFSRKKKEKKE